MRTLLTPWCAGNVRGARAALGEAAAASVGMDAAMP